MLSQSNVQWELTFLWSTMSVRAAGWAPTRTRRVSWSVSPALKEPPQPTYTLGVWGNVKVGFLCILGVRQYFVLFGNTSKHV